MIDYIRQPRRCRGYACPLAAPPHAAWPGDLRYGHAACSCYELHVVCYKSHVVCYKLHAVCYKLHAVIRMQPVRAAAIGRRETEQLCKCVEIGHHAEL